MAPHSSTLAWRIPWTEEPGGLQSRGLQRVRCDWNNLAHKAKYRKKKIMWWGWHGWDGIVVVQLPSHVWLFAVPWTAARQASLSSTISLSLLKFLSIELMLLSNHLNLCCPLLLLPSNFPSIRVWWTISQYMSVFLFPWIRISVLYSSHRIFCMLTVSAQERHGGTL